ncbi:hypothetical protein DL767_006940 [Monosporascus sp. MG133]|nr:hypothetical protein DL767_006940 [Monosporascus sp. MG133]
MALLLFRKASVYGIACAIIQGPIIKLIGRKETSNSSKRPRGNEIIKLSSDNDDDDSCSNEPVQGESVDDEHNGKRPTSSEFGGRHANRHIGDED